MDNNNNNLPIDIVDPATHSRGIELTLRNLSLSVIPPPSLLTRVARKLKLAHNPDKQPEANDAPSSKPDLDEEAKGRIDRDLRNVGINIFRNVDMSVKPGQGWFPLFSLYSFSSSPTLLLSHIARSIAEKRRADLQPAAQAGIEAIS